MTQQSPQQSSQSGQQSPQSGQQPAQQSFSRPGAVDLSGLAGPPAGGTAGSAGPAGSAYTVAVTEQNFQQLLQDSTTAPVVLVFHSESQAPGSAQYAADVSAVVDEQEGRLLAGTVDIDAHPQIAQAMQIPQVPLMLVVLDGRPATQPIPGALGRDELATLFGQLSQQLTAQGITGRHQPRHVAADGGDGGEGEGSPSADPRYAGAQEALAEGDIDRAVQEYRTLVEANPADSEAAAGLAMAQVLQRTQGVDLAEARQAAADAPDDVAAQTLVADLDLLGGHVEDAFDRLVGLVARTADDERTAAREHLLGLFAAVGHDDQRVLAARRNLASALF